MPEKIKSRRQPLRRAGSNSSAGEYGNDRAGESWLSPVEEYSEAIGEEVCARLMIGETLRQIALLPGMPGEATIYEWLRSSPEFEARYREARGIQVEKLSDEILEIADDSRNDWVQRENERTRKATVALNSEAVQRSKLRVAARQWLIGRGKAKGDGGRVERVVPGGIDDGVRILTEERRAVLMAMKRDAMLRRLEREKMNETPATPDV